MSCGVKISTFCLALNPNKFSLPVWTLKPGAGHRGRQGRMKICRKATNLSHSSGMNPLLTDVK